MHLYGYQHPSYAHSFRCYGEPIHLPRSNAWLLRRSVPGSPYHDAMGLYPLFICRDWSKLSLDLKALSRQWIALSLVTDPFGEFDHQELSACFPDVCMPFKIHHIINLNQPRSAFISQHHQRYARKALKTVSIDVCEYPNAYLKEWTKLYHDLIKRHDIKGMTRFSDSIFSVHLNVPGSVVFKAMVEDRITGMQIWYQINDKAYYHLGACNDEGYANHAAFGLFWTAIEYFEKNDVLRLNLGSGAGTTKGKEDGLTRFKRGWANDSQTVYFCGVVSQSTPYQAMTYSSTAKSNGYFPAYRTGEFS